MGEVKLKLAGLWSIIYYLSVIDLMYINHMTHLSCHSKR